MKKNNVALFVFITLGLLLLGACNKPKAEPEASIPDVGVLAQDMLAELYQINSVMSAAITAQGGKLGNQEEIRALLVEAQKAHPSVLTSCFVDSKGILKYLEPSTYKDSEGADISKQVHTIAMLQNPAPMIIAS